MNAKITMVDHATIKEGHVTHRQQPSNNVSHNEGRDLQLKRYLVNSLYYTINLGKRFCIYFHLGLYQLKF